jgi:hypothetical protein
MGEDFGESRVPLLDDVTPGISVEDKGLTRMLGHDGQFRGVQEGFQVQECGADLQALVMESP